MRYAVSYKNALQRDRGDHVFASGSYESDNPFAPALNMRPPFLTKPSKRIDEADRFVRIQHFIHEANKLKTFIFIFL